MVFGSFTGSDFISRNSPYVLNVRSLSLEAEGDGWESKEKESWKENGWREKQSLWELLENDTRERRSITSPTGRTKKNVRFTEIQM